MTPPAGQAPQEPGTAGSYLPDFCSGTLVLGVVLVTELVAIILTAARFPASMDFWTDLARASMFLLWTGLLSAFVLCHARPMLAGRKPAMVTLVALLLLLATTALVSEAAYWLGRYYASLTGGPSDALFPAGHDAFLLRNLAICGIVSALALRYFYVSHQWKRNVEMEARSRIRALQARIRPHFLFNSMNTIASLTRSNPEVAEQAVEDLADLFRSSLRDSNQRVTLKDELEMARIYQRIEALRLGQRLTVEWRVDALPMRAMIPGLTLQPLLENAIYHGIEPLPDGGVVTVDGHSENGRVIIRVANPVPAEEPRHRREGNRMAMSNIRERFELAYEGKATVTVDSNPGVDYAVSLNFPLVEQQR